jgi:nitroreductase
VQHLNLTSDELLTTTRAVRRRLDLTRPVEHEVLEECVRLAVQAPTSTNSQNWHFLVVTDAAKRAAITELYLRSWIPYNGGRHPSETPPDTETGPEGASRHLAAHLHEVPVHVFACIEGRPEGLAPADLAWFYGSIIQAGWSFQLALRERGLGSVWTTHHLDYEREAAEVLGIPYASVTQVALLPVAYTVGTDFKPARRNPLETVLHWQTW